jgi:hypothetical protein
VNTGVVHGTGIQAEGFVERHQDLPFAQVLRRNPGLTAARVDSIRAHCVWLSMLDIYTQPEQPAETMIRRLEMESLRLEQILRDPRG